MKTKIRYFKTSDLNHQQEINETVKNKEVHKFGSMSIFMMFIEISKNNGNIQNAFPLIVLFEVQNVNL